MYLFDTDSLSNILKKNPSALMIEKLMALPGELQFTTSIIISEIYFGAYLSINRKKSFRLMKKKFFQI